LAGLSLTPPMFSTAQPSGDEPITRLTMASPGSRLLPLGEDRNTGRLASCRGAFNGCRLDFRAVLVKLEKPQMRIFSHIKFPV
jgi:hypothetical protein